METDSFFCQLLKRLPQTLFQMLGLPGEAADRYRFDSVELKKSLRIDGLFVPTEGDLPIYFVEVLFYRKANFYANLFAKVFGFLDENDPGQEWVAVAIFGSRKLEPGERGPYENLLSSKRVQRIYLDELALPPDPPLGLGILKLVTVEPEDEKSLVRKLLRKAETEIADRESARTVVELVEELLVRRHPKLNREEVRAMFHLADIRKTRVWQEAVAEGREEGRQVGREEGREEGRTLEQADVVRKLLTNGMAVKDIAKALDLPPARVRQLAKKKS